MGLRPAKQSDMAVILDMIADSRDFLKAQGIDQWQGVYPGQGDIALDMDKHYAYVYDVDGRVAAYVALIWGEDPVYTAIDGAWQSSAGEYLSLHRVMVSSHYRGQHIGRQLFEAVEVDLPAGSDIRCDTHPDNRIMQQLLTSRGFSYQGTVVFDSLRYAYQKIIKEQG